MAKSLLLADDSQTFHRVVELCLGQEDVTVIATRSADEALAKARELKPDLVLADSVMPGKSGYDLAAELRRDPSLASVPVLILASTTEGPVDENRVRQSGADAAIAKPFQSQALIDEVRKLLAAPRPAAARPPAPRATAVPPPPRPPSAAAPPRPAATTTPAPVRPPAPRPPGAPAAARPATPGAPSIPPAPRPAALARPPTPGAPAAARPATMPPPARPAVPGAPAARPAGALPPAARPPGAPAPRPAGTLPPPARPAGAAPAPRAPGTLPPPARPATAAPAARPTAVTPQNHEALLREALSTATREMIEKIVWEVVPELAETMIKEELGRLMKERQARAE